MNINTSKVLWTNSSPASSFAAQTISVTGLSDYNLIAVLARMQTQQNYILPIVIVSKEFPNGILNFTNYYNGGHYERKREFTALFSTNQIQFALANENGSTNSDHLVPVQVVGLF